MGGPRRLIAMAFVPPFQAAEQESHTGRAGRAADDGVSANEPDRAMGWVPATDCSGVMPRF